jgi:hypothetical protein
MTMNIQFNRKQYTAGETDIDTYYGQFVSAGLKAAISRRIGVQRITQSIDPHLNDIPLCEWDNLADLVKSYCGSALADSNASTSNGVRGISLSDCVCVAKVAARMIRDESKGSNND